MVGQLTLCSILLSGFSHLKEKKSPTNKKRGRRCGQREPRLPDLTLSGKAPCQ
jgi:hypothetical protein